MCELILKLDRYIYLEDELESLIIFKIVKNNEIIDLKKIQYPCNPLLDVELLNLRNKHLIKVIKKLNNIIINKNYSNKNLSPIIDFRKNIIKNYFSEFISQSI